MLLEGGFLFVLSEELVAKGSRENGAFAEFSFFTRKMYNDGGLYRKQTKGPFHTRFLNGKRWKKPLISTFTSAESVRIDIVVTALAEFYAVHWKKLSSNDGC